MHARGVTAPASAPLTTPDAPWSVAVVSEKIRGWIARLGDVWVEGQVVQFTERPGSWMQYLTLRDVEAEASLSVKIPSRALATSTARIEKGARVLVHAKPDFWTGNGSFALLADEVRPVGVGELLARIEHLRRILAAEGLFDESRKTRLPFLPHVVGLVTGRNSDAKHDVMKNALLRWPQVRFEVREVAVQGPSAVREVKAAIAELDARPEVEVVVVARGGGALEDLLPFSDESLVRAAAACRTPLVSAIGHEQDCPLLDLVADLRASTPTDAAKRVVPDVAEERRRVEQARRTMRHALRARLDREQHGLDGVRSRPVLARPESMIEHREREIAYRVTHARHVLNAALLRASGEIGRLEAQVRALSPASTLERGYAVVQRPDGHVVRSPDDAAPGTGVRLRLAAGELAATVDG
ncbi:exodeoxyribonuclease VII, large subunit [Xylanimonas cellulosilytica DSM 15894]|uniref:Exodeoxyribonuclease 7 large subunit n=1 Tax=Xylanimonas cellulosilytica (strain DSM 15894 / JCM 12276 / CECT 5975 / KCTC 9989 / LMG 20990 / NBRC 107835 / XIL07) TaxID=446471 RepID=D1BYP5_XYLCX|nr:exodeoxyribonuclease VII, large subunit [Xylanimonas cellulosilytica DSM 15894]